MSQFKLFLHTDNQSKRTYNSEQESTDDDLAGETGQDQSGGETTFSPKSNYRRFYLHPPVEKDLEELLAKLMHSAKFTSGEARNKFLEQMVIFLKLHPHLINVAPKKLEHNPLELVLEIGTARHEKELRQMRAHVRPHKLAQLAEKKHLQKSEPHIKLTY